MAFAVRSLFLLCGINTLLNGVWPLPLGHWKNIKCPSGWTQLDCHCYMYEATAATFVAADADCIDNGGNLVSIHNDLENEIVVQLIEDGGGTQAWIGLHDAIVDNDFIWTDGSIQDFLNFDTDDLEPNDTGSCVLIETTDALWQDELCTDTNPYVCIMDVCQGGDPSSPDCPGPSMP
ncbi:ladderlectin-like [Hippocampus zosterae]|uniref:ladderlectin-like n=1 Tax=Hippocampus zosterae TaxID=109293 RepID=UPI00223CE61A|nr:ladderlectin-like [Hippocampus zosterae]XP_051916281.1 ladderlectin-like [Hippocampus zosterae]